MKFITLLLIFTLIFPAPLFAEPPDEIEPPKVTGIKKGEEAPYNGVLLNTTAAAKIFADKEFSAKECELRINFEVQKEILRMQLLLDVTKASLEATEQKYTSILSIKDTEIERLAQIATKRPNNYSVWWATGGVLVGIGLTLAVVYSVKEISN
jgi:hypothetical protein